ncbi:MAG: hypothetical protein J7604_17740 [Sporocytophaga sp.]|uniref:hypothetical protein n=1 Tax=Sporocytophaga sp. TaxID=2231183 RepID=UPI001B14287C|nr:hypothetical protein [Sporocytophaga sp.]MBO9702055.1 hypothetical protein [Sporocytophaga sp.]
MEKIFIYNNRKVAFQFIVIGISIWLIMIFIPLNVARVFLFFIGGNFFYIGANFVSGKPQIIISEEGLFLAYNFNKTISWRSIVEVKVKVYVDDEEDKEEFLFLKLRVKSKGPSNILEKEFSVVNLTMSIQEIVKIISDTKSVLENK